MATGEVFTGGNIEPRGLEEEMRSSYLDYAMSVIVGRALPDARDGLKPVHRRVLYAMNELGLQPNRAYSKSAKIVGEVMGNYHPHGDSAIYDTLVRLAQDFSMRSILVDGQGNFGSVDDDPPAAMRYTEARLAPLAREMLRDLDADTVDFVPNYANDRVEPTVLPARFPNLLVNGSSGIAVGMATNIPPHNLREAIEATIAYIDDPDITVEGLMAHLKGPDFPTGGIILGLSGIRDAYETGRGRVRIRARAHFEEIGRGKEAIIVTEMPFQVKKGGDSGVIKKIVELVHDKKLPEISDIRDESDGRTGMRLVIELKRDANPKVVLNKLYKHTALQSTFGVNMVALVDNVPRTLGLKQVLHNYVQHQRDVIVRRSKHELRKLEARKHILEGQLIALDNLDDVIDLIRAAPDRDTARAGLIERFGLTYIQAQSILELRLAQLTALESDQIRRDHADIVERITELRTLLGDEGAVMTLIKDELREIGERYGDDRRTQLSPSEDEIDIEDLIKDQQMVVTITNTGYIKSLPLATYRQQRRGGVGIAGMDMKDEDYIEHLFVCSTHDYLLFFTNRGKVYRSKVYDLPEMSRTSKGRYLGNVLPLREGETVEAVLATRDYSEAEYLMFATKNGTVKKTDMQAYNTPIKADGIIAINIRDDDELVAVRRVDPGDEVLMVSRQGLTVRFSEADARSMGRDTSGVRGMDVSGKGNAVIAMDIARDDQYLLVVTDAGFGKRTLVSEYRKTQRGAKGVKTITQTEAKGDLAGAMVVREHHEVVFISQQAKVQRVAVRDFRPLGRSAQGFRLMNIKDDDEVAAVALIVETDAPATAGVGEPVSLDASGDADEPALLPEAGDPNDSLLGVDPAAAESGELPEGPTEPGEMGDSRLDE
jgi:DNA gyrase subunit A